MALERVKVHGPEPAERSQPGFEFFKWFRLQPIESTLCVHRGLYETGVAQHSQVLRDGWLGHTKLTLDLPNRLFRRDQEAQYRPTIRLRDDFEHRLHVLDILCSVYACQGIYSYGQNQPELFFNS